MSHVYWTENATGVIGRFTAGTMTVQHIRTGEGQPSGIDVDATHVYWCTESPGAVKRMSLDGEDVEILAVSPQPTGIVVTDDAVVWGDFTAGTISRLAK